MTVIGNYGTDYTADNQRADYSVVICTVVFMVAVTPITVRIIIIIGIRVAVARFPVIYRPGVTIIPVSAVRRLTVAGSSSVAGVPVATVSSVIGVPVTGAVPADTGPCLVRTASVNGRSCMMTGTASARTDLLILPGAFA